MKKTKTYDPNHGLKKAKRLEKAKKDSNRADKKRKNSELKKAKEEKAKNYEKIDDVQIIGYEKGMLLLIVEEEKVKRALVYPKAWKLDEENLDRVEVKIFGVNVKLCNIANYEAKKADILWALGE